MNKSSFSHIAPLAQLLLFFCFTLIGADLSAQSATISVQGVLTKTDGTAVDDGQYPITFRLWTAESGGAMVHEETIQQVETTGGVYSVLLGQNGFNGGATFSQVYYLGVSVNGGAELTPRPRLTHAPYTISVIGQNNKFTSTGPVEADGYKVNGGVPAGGVAGTGYSFRGGGDQDGGLFSYQDNQVSLFTNAVEQLKISNGLTELLTPNTNTNNLFTYGFVHSNSGFYYHSNGPGTGQFTGMALGNGVLNLRANDQERLVLWNDGSNYYRTPSVQHIFDQGSVRMDHNLSVSGTISSGSIIRTDGLSENGGFTFRYNNGSFNDDDTGMFGTSDGSLGLYANGNVKFRIDPGFISMNGTTELNLGANDYLYLNGIKPKGTTGNARNLAIDLSSGRVFEESSSRRFKRNIRPLTEDFRLILKAQPVIYNRYEDPIDIDTAKYYEIGYIAEEMDSIGLKKLIQYDEDGQIGSFNYDKMILYAVEVLKMQDAALTQLQAEVTALKAEKAELTAENTALKNQQAQFSTQLDDLSKRLKLIESASATTGMRK